MKDQQVYWHFHHSDYRNTLIHVHTTLCTLPTFDMSLGSQTVGMPEAKDFMGSLKPYMGHIHAPKNFPFCYLKKWWGGDIVSSNVTVCTIHPSNL